MAPILDGAPTGSDQIGWIEMLVEGFKGGVEEVTRAKAQSGRERPNLSCCARECLAQCPLGGTSLLPSRVRSSKRETKPDIGLLLVPILQLLGCFSSSGEATSAKPSQRNEAVPICSDFRAPSRHGSLQQLWLHFRLELEEPEAPWLRSSMELIARGSRRFSSITRGWSM